MAHPEWRGLAAVIKSRWPAFVVANLCKFYDDGDNGFDPIIKIPEPYDQQAVDDHCTAISDFI